VFVILASRHDAGAAALAAACAELEPAIMTARDLSAAGWEYRVPGEAVSAVVSGMRIRCRDIRGMLTRLAAVNDEELDHVAPGDRSYVATEMTAFLATWLSELECPVLNRPTPNCLVGPNWRLDQWLRLAAQIGIPVVERQRDTASAATEERVVEGTTVTVIGERCLGYAHPVLATHARRLARAAKVELLAVQFTGPKSSDRLTGAHLWPDLTVGECSAAIVERFCGRATC
jgi:hypothetical protein